jgi:hypothetical protein
MREGGVQRSRRWVIGAVVIACLGLACYIATAAPPQRSLRQFDPQRTANLETRMWQAYYGKERARLFGLLVTLLREQYHYSWATAVWEGFHLARAAATFGDATGNYERVLPDLEQGYATAKAWLRAGFDPHAVARAELAWWVARRTPGQNTPAQVGELMADEYALLYEAPRARMLKAATLRAEAGALRDTGATKPDWPVIRRLLEESYGELRTALDEPNSE